MRRYLPLKGFRVLSFEVAYSLPAGTRTLSELGAEVVRVAPPNRPAGNYIAVVDGVFLGKPCIGINLKTEGGQGLARRLVQGADAVASNFTPPVMRGFGLGHEELRELKPDLIVLQLSGYGSPGPWSSFPAFGPSTEAAGGMNGLMGVESDPPVRVGSGVFADQLSGRYAALALVAAIEDRNRTGRGRYIDLSMTECITHLLGPSVLSAAIKRRLPERRGNRDRRYAPQGIYPCSGDDEWIAITVKGDEQWESLVGLVGDERLEAPELQNLECRWMRHDEIDSVLSEWTALSEKARLAQLLQSHGIAAGPVRKVHDSLFDEHLWARGFFQMVRHEAPILGFAAHPHPTTPWVADGRKRAHLTDTRYTGEDNYSVLSRWLGLNRVKVRGLVESGALWDAGELHVEDRPGAPGAPRDPGFGERLGLPPAGGKH